jgi:hypothetical protein
LNTLDNFVREQQENTNHILEQLNTLDNFVHEQQANINHILEQLDTFVRKQQADTITAIHTFNPTEPGPAFQLGPNAQNQLIPYLNADKVDGFDVSQTPAPNVIVPLNADGVLDLSQTYVKSSVYTFRRVDLTGATSDYLLQVGEEAIVRFTNATSVSLRIALVNDAVYEFFSPSIPQGSLLYPNNTAFSSQFIAFRLYVYWTGSSYDVGYDGNTASGFFFFAEINRALIINDLTAKRILASYGDIPRRHIGISGSLWNNTTTPWTSLGTISFSWPISGFILVRRLV